MQQLITKTEYVATVQETNPGYQPTRRASRFAKGSDEAREYMAMIRGRKRASDIMSGTVSAPKKKIIAYFARDGITIDDAAVNAISAYIKNTGVDILRTVRGFAVDHGHTNIEKKHLKFLDAMRLMTVQNRGRKRAREDDEE